MYSAFIVDDEALARSNLIDALRNQMDWTVTGTFSSGLRLYDSVVDLKPDVVFLDIKMPGDSGLLIAKRLLGLKNPPLIVFVTAFSEYAVQAFELYAVDYLLKPFDDARIEQCANKLAAALNNQALHRDKLAAQEAWAHTRPLRQLVVKSSNSVRVIPIEDVEWLAANGNYVDIHHCGNKHLLRGSLKNVLMHLASSDFVQVHRGVVVRLSMIREIKTLDDERSILVLSNNIELPVGKSYKAALLSLLVQTTN